MPTVAQLAARRAVAVVDLGDGVAVNLEYYPDRISPRIIRQYIELINLFERGPALAAAVQTEEDMERVFLSKLDNLAGILATLISSWDLQEEEGGSMVALTAERLALFGFPLLLIIFQAIFGSVQQGEAKGTISHTRSNGTLHRKRK